MNKLLLSSLVLPSLLTMAPSLTHGAEDADTAPHKAPMARQDSMLATIDASVESIDYKTREITLKGPLGNSVTFTVSPRVKRFNEIKVGDTVQADYYVSVAAELRKPTPEEAQHPLEVIAAGGKAPLSSEPGAAALRTFKVVTTVEGMDRSQRTVTVKGPRGRTLTAKVERPEVLSELHLGDTIVITYTEALAVSLDKLKKSE